MATKFPKYDPNVAALAGKQPLAAVLTGTTASFTAGLEAKLSGIAVGATANSNDATLLARANHTGAQAISTVTGLQTALDAKVAASSALTTGFLVIGSGAAAVTPTTIEVTGGNNLSLGSVDASELNVDSIDWGTTVVPSGHGGTGVNNAGSITLGGDLTTLGAFSTTITATGTTNVTLPTSGTLATVAQVDSASGMSARSLKFWPNADAVESGWSLTGVNGIPECTTPDADWKAVVKVEGTVADPVFSVASGEVADDSTVEITCATSGASIRYTTNGDTPTRASGTVYSGAITITDDVTIKAIAYKDYSIDSAVTDEAYTIPAGAPIPDLLHWELNEGTGSTISAAVGPGATFTLGTDGEWTTSTQSGTGAAIDVLYTTTSSVVESTSNITYATNQVTVSGWFNVPVISSLNGPILVGSNGSVNTWKIRHINGNLAAQLYGTTGSRYVTATTADPAINTWHHFAVTFDNSTEAGDVKMYINGVELTSPTLTTNTKTGTGNFAAGKFYVKDPFTQSWVGKLDDLRVYSGILTPSEIAALHAGGAN